MQGSVQALRPSSVNFHGCRSPVPRSSLVLIAHSASTFVSLLLASLQKFVGFSTLISSNGRCLLALCALQCAQ
ncbi:MAG: hypothetical protein JW395_3604 [Nitrospira sp.]|nr:hypothetical protein [Nitrospira sp.]